MYTIIEVNKDKTACIMRFLFIQFLEDNISYVVLSSVDLQHTSVPSSFHSKGAKIGDEHRHKAEVGTEGEGFCQMIM